MKQHLVCHLPSTPESGRNSEGSFLRAPDGSILFAYSHYNTSDTGDDAPCDIALIRSHDEGETWSRPEIIARASDFGVKNIMSVSGLMLRDGGLCFFFLVKLEDGASRIGRSISHDGITFTSSLCDFKHVQHAYYVINNDRFIRLSDGRIAAPAAKYNMSPWIGEGYSRFETDTHAVPVCFVSDDDGASFSLTRAHIDISGRLAQELGLEEPGIIELPGSVIYLWARTTLCYQYQCFSFDGMNTFTPPEPSVFTSPRSPMELYRSSDQILWAIYNPIPNYNGRAHHSWTGRTPFVLRYSADNGQSWSALYTIENDPNANYCYPALIETKDNALLCAYMRNICEEDMEKNTVHFTDMSLCIMKIDREGLA